MKWSRRRSLGFILSVCGAFWAGVVAAVYLMVGAHAAPVELTHRQQSDIIRINQQQNNRTPHVNSYGHGQCVLIAELKRMAMIRYGIPADALNLRRVRSPFGGEPFHELLDIDAIVDGRPWRVSFDMNFPWPLTRREEAEIGYQM